MRPVAPCEAAAADVRALPAPLSEGAVEAYGNWIECETVEAVKCRLKRDLCALYMEGLTIRERLLGSTFVDIPRSVIYRGAVYADASRFDRCVPLWLHALR